MAVTAGDRVCSSSPLKESIWEKPADFPSDEAPGSSNDNGSQEEPIAPKPELLSEGDSSNEASQQATITEQANQMPEVPKINFRVRPGTE